VILCGFFFLIPRFLFFCFELLPLLATSLFLDFISPGGFFFHVGFYSGKRMGLTSEPFNTFPELFPLKSSLDACRIFKTFFGIVTCVSFCRFFFFWLLHAP